MTHKLTGREVFDALREEWQGHRKRQNGEACFDALALCLNESTVDNGNHDAVVRAVTRD